MITKVLVVDDSVVFRKILMESLSNQRGIRVLDACANGREALIKIRQLKPDVVVLDVEMPEMDGIQTLQEIKRQKLDVGVIMFSGLTQEGAQVTFDALSNGAFDFVPKPSGSANFYESVQKTRRELTEKIKAYMEHKLSKIPRRPVPPLVKPKTENKEESTNGKAVELKETETNKKITEISRESKAQIEQNIIQSNQIASKSQDIALKSLSFRRFEPRIILRKNIQEKDANNNLVTESKPQQTRPIQRTTTLIGKIEAVGIGISTGGPNALQEVIPKFPANFPVPILIVQHMPPVFTTQLAKRLDDRSQLKVVEAQDNMPVEPGMVYIAPGDFHMTVAVQNGQKVIRLNQDPPENSCRPAVDVLFKSLAQVYANRALGVIMTGMGQDGLKGATIMKEKGSYIIAQDKESSVVYGMPRFVIEAGLADRICSLDEIASCIIQIVGVTSR